MTKLTLKQTDQSHENEKEEGHDIDDLIFIDDDTDKEEE